MLAANFVLLLQGGSDFLKRFLSYSIDPNSKDHDHRTPLHIAAAEGIYLIAKMLLENGASVFSMDRVEKFGIHVSASNDGKLTNLKDMHTKKIRGYISFM